ncbi:UNVERIFIED_CONTAM: G-type lectin S-receptor-like serine/threonine-protein kinase LECRK4 [Sesamum radiatum]|uniref:non-specific serine/threonine protein kinase n=1 Tax=Sesamum radiatum TaxID=300843 RepID=A0AAW2VBB2_SESRA
MSQGCKPNFNLPSCQQNGWESSVDSVEFKELNNTDWPFTDYELQTGPDVDKERCKEFCLRDCYCAAAIYNENNCWKKRFPLSNGKQSASVNRIALIKVPRNINQTTLCPKRKDQSTLVLVVSILLGSSVFFNFLLLIAISVAIFLIYHKKMLNLQPASTLYGIRRYTYKELEDATEGFKQQLGRGSFGTVYKGVIHSNPMRHIAIKKLDMAEKEGENEFTTEVNAVGQTHHKNLVNLLGYCDEGTNRLLVYEYMSNGSLASLLFSTSRPRWNQRLQIAFGIARGLTYLHEECSTQIIHCDVKPQNILLDEYLIPKISDFGLAKLLLSEQSRAARTHIRGTVGYFAPEWFRKASITSKVDVYSFGVMLLEIVCCMSSVKFAMGDQEEALTDWVYDCYSQEKLEMLVEDDEEAMNDMNGVARLVMVAIWCIQEDPSLRPSMRRVTQLLEGVAQLSDPPRPSAVGSTRIAASERQ